MPRIIMSSAITAVAGTSMTITVSAADFIPKQYYILLIGQTMPSDITGTEAVSIAVTGGEPMPLIDNAGDVVRAGSMRGAIALPNGFSRDARYRLQYGADGLPEAIAHFEVHNGLERSNVNQNV